ncbi:condensation domain-containing protein [Micromonospora echinospora]
MVPTAYVTMTALPMTANGKLDRAALPAPAHTTTSTHAAPRNARQTVLCQLFAAVLGLPEVGTGDNFFDLGGHSLLATRLVNRIRATLGVDLGVRHLFANPTVATLEPHLSTGITRAALTVAPRPDPLPASFAQRRLWVLHRIEGPSATYNVPVTTRLHGPVDADALRAAVDDLVDRHEILRTLYTEADGEPTQRILDPAPGIATFTHHRIPAEQAEQLLTTASAHPFDLTREAPLAVHLITTGERDHLLLVNLHHIAGDGASMAPLARDLATAYTARAAGHAPDWEPLPVQYADYALWQQALLGTDDDPDSEIRRQLDYWGTTLAGLPEELPLPTDHPRPAQATYRAGRVDLTIDPATHTALRAVARQHDATLFMVVQAAIATLLTRLGAGTDIPLGTVVAGRTDDTLDHLPAGGGMLAVGGLEEQVREVVGAGVDVAAVNGPGSVVLSGAVAELDRVAELCAERGWRTKRLAVSHAFHSRLVEPMLEGFRAAIAGLTWSAPRVPIVSNLTGRVADPGEIAGPEYWVRHVREAVRFADGVTTLHGLGVSTVLEVGPDATLTAMAADTPADRTVHLIPALRRDQSETTALVTALARLHVTGTAVDWTGWFTQGGQRPRTVDLPTYAFQKERYWLHDTPPATTVPAAVSASASDERFWAAVEQEDLAGLGEEFRLDADQPLSALLPRLARWRREGQQRSTADSWRYRIDWTAVPDAEPALSGRWLLLVPYLGLDGALLAAVTDGLTAAGAEVRPVPFDGPADDRDLVAKALRDVGDVTGVVSLLSLAGGGVGDALAVVQALGAAGVGGRVWWLTRGAVSLGASDSPVDEVGAAVWGFGRVAALEEPRRWGGLVDLPQAVSERAADRGGCGCGGGARYGHDVG